MIECKLENGKSRNDLRHVTVSVIGVNEKAEVLLMKKAPGQHEGNKFTIPGGFMRRDEELVGTALRELEKTGYFGKMHMLFHINDFPHRPVEDRQNLDFVFIFNIVGGEPKLNDEIIALNWYPFDKLPPAEEFAYDHRKTVELYFQYQNSHFPVPIIGKA